MHLLLEFLISKSQILNCSSSLIRNLIGSGHVSAGMQGLLIMAIKYFRRFLEYNGRTYIWSVFFELGGCYHTFNCNSPRDGSIETFSLEIVSTACSCFNQKSICTVINLAILKIHFKLRNWFIHVTHLYLSVFKIKKYICIYIFFWLFHHVTILNIKEYSLPLTERKTTNTQIQPTTWWTIWTRIF